MEGRLDGTKISHELTAARLLTIYGHKGAADFITDNISCSHHGDPEAPDVDPNSH